MEISSQHCGYNATLSYYVFIFGYSEQEKKLLINIAIKIQNNSYITYCLILVLSQRRRAVFLKSSWLIVAAEASSVLSQSAAGWEEQAHHHNTLILAYNMQSIYLYICAGLFFFNSAFRLEAFEVFFRTSCVAEKGRPGENFSAWFIDVWSIAAEASFLSAAVCLRKRTDQMRERGS